VFDVWVFEDGVENGVGIVFTGVDAELPGQVLVELFQVEQAGAVASGAVHSFLLVA
jgi:hypothetical protein